MFNTQMIHLRVKTFEISQLREKVCEKEIMLLRIKKIISWPITVIAAYKIGSSRE